MAKETTMVSYTTPSLKIKITHMKSSIVLSDFAEIHVTFAQGATVVDVSSPRILSDYELIVELTQEQTAKFKSWPPVDVMINLVSAGGQRFANKDPIQVTVVDNLLKQVLP